MIKDDNINIKLEVFKDKFSGKISIIAHFNNTAPNIYKDNDEYIWFPTIDEKNLILEAFELTSTTTNNSYKEKTTTPTVTNQQVASSTVPVSPSRTDPNLNIQHSEPQYTEKKPQVIDFNKDVQTKDFKENQNLPKTNNLIKNEEVKNFKPEPFSNSADVKTYEPNQNIEHIDPYYKPKQEEVKKESQYVKNTHKEKKELNEGVITEVETNAIDAALKKYTDKEEYMVQADEKTIVDKVLSQKKKGKWNRR